MLELNITSLAFTVINLLVLFFIVKKFLVKPVMKIIQQREEMVRHQFVTASTAQKQAEEMRAKYEAQLKSSKQQAEEIFVNAKLRAGEERERIIEEARNESSRLMDRAKLDIVAAQQKAEQEAQVEIAKLALLAARKIIKTGEANDTGSKE